jgi:hypothetical protein
MTKAIRLFAMIMGMVLLFASCVVTTAGGGRVESCGANPKYCSPG